jgi:hypothetical protein
MSMARPQQHQVSNNRWQQAGYSLGLSFKRAGTWWAGVEKRLIQRAGAQGQMMKAGLLLFKVVLAVIAIVAGLYALYWVALVVGLVVAAAFSGGKAKPLSDDGLLGPDGLRYGHEGFGYYMGGTRMDSDDD